METSQIKWGFLRETEAKAKQLGLDADTGLHRTGLDTYLSAIYPEVTDWIHDKCVKGLLVDGKQSLFRPDYRSETLKMIVEFDGIQHYQNPEKILADKFKTDLFTKAGYKVIRIPYFIQLTNKVIKTLFNVEIETPMFDESIPSIGVKGKCTPAFLCPTGVIRMAKEFHDISPEQYIINVNAVRSYPDELTGLSLLEAYYKSL
jgi:hypothetical protein